MYIIKVYKDWNAFFWVIIISFIAQSFFMVKGIENVPFFLYHMYGYAHQPKDSFNVILIKTPHGYFNPFDLSGRESEMLMNNTLYYITLKKNHWRDPIISTVEKRFSNKLPKNIYDHLQQGLVNDSIHFIKYTDWWGQYFRSIYKNSFKSVSVVSSYIKYSPEPSKSSFDSIVFICHFK